MSKRDATSSSGGSGAYPASVDRLIAEFARLPGIGRRSAERLAFHILKSNAEDAEALASAIMDVKHNVRYCRVCFNFAEEEVCRLCSDTERDAALILVVEQPKDLIALEQTAMYRGVYHVLLGRLSPLEGVEPGDLTIGDLLRRVERPDANCRGVKVEEVILGLNPTLEGDGTALHLTDTLRKRGVKVSRLARGLPSGGQLEFASKAVLADALEGRRPMND
ncbi:MAG: recombination mediator RecR [Phycisphaerales bacterium]